MLVLMNFYKVTELASQNQRFVYFLKPECLFKIRKELRKKYKYSSTFRACEQGEGYFGIFSNLACLSAFVPRGTLKNRCIKRCAFFRGTFKNRSFSNTPSAIYPPWSASSSFRRVFCLYTHKNAVLREK